MQRQSFLASNFYPGQHPKPQRRFLHQGNPYTGSSDRDYYSCTARFIAGRLPVCAVWRSFTKAIECKRTSQSFLPSASSPIQTNTTHSRKTFCAQLMCSFGSNKSTVIPSADNCENTEIDRFWNGCSHKMKTLFASPNNWNDISNRHWYQPIIQDHVLNFISMYQVNVCVTVTKMCSFCAAKIFAKNSYRLSSYFVCTVFVYLQIWNTVSEQNSHSLLCLPREELKERHERLPRLSIRLCPDLLLSSGRCVRDTDPSESVVECEHFYLQNSKSRLPIKILWEPTYDIFVLRFRPKKQQFSVALPTP